MYRTGDLAKYNIDGSICYMGRTDNQIKLRGHRIELGEIEHCLMKELPEMDGIDGVVAEVISPNGSPPTLIAFLCRKSITSDSNKGILKAGDLSKTSRDKLTAQLASTEDRLGKLLPHYSIPSTYAILEQIPLTTSGKTDRKRLRNMASELSRSDMEVRVSLNAEQRPVTDCERVLQQGWAKILRIADPSSLQLTDNFFRAGGDSVSAMRLVAELRNLGIALTVVNIFEHPTLKDMAAMASMSSPPDESPYEPFSSLGSVDRQSLLQEKSLSRFQREDFEDVYPVTGFQEMAMIAHLQKVRGLLNFIHLDFNGSVEQEKLEMACRSMMIRFESLRSVMMMHKGDIFQAVIKASAMPVPLEYFEGGDDVDKFCESIRTQESESNPVDFGQLFTRFYLIRHGGNKQRLMIRLSHAQYDGISLPQIVQGLQEAYSDGGGLNSPTLRKTRPPYSHFAAYAARISASATSIAFWKELLEGAEMSQLVKPAIPMYNRNADKTIMRSLYHTAAAGNHQTTFANVLKAAWAVVLSQATNTKDVVFGALVSGRNAPISDIDKIVGACISKKPVSHDSPLLKLLATNEALPNSIYADCFSFKISYRSALN